MLRKLFKYEIKATGRIFLPMYALLLVFAGVTRVFMEINTDFMRIPQVLTSVLYGFLVIGVFVLTIAVAIQRFYKNLLGDEGYLMFTLPVKAHSHITAKLFTTLMWAVLSVVATLLSIVILSAKSNFFDVVRRFFTEWGSASAVYGAYPTVIILEVILLAKMCIRDRLCSSAVNSDRKPRFFKRGFFYNFCKNSVN